MTDSIDFSPLGTVDVTIDDKTYHLGRPKFKQWKHFSAALEQARADAQSRVDAAIRRAAAADQAHAANPTEATAAEVEASKAETRAIKEDPFYNRTMDIVADMFAQCGDPLPDDRDDWPAFLADPNLPVRILGHWQQSPKASGAAPPS